MVINLRAEFEAWVKSNHPERWPNPHTDGSYYDANGYYNAHLDLMWRSWLQGSGAQVTIDEQKKEIARLKELYRREREAHAANLKEQQKCEQQIRDLREHFEHIRRPKPFHVSQVVGIKRSEGDVRVVLPINLILTDYPNMIVEVILP